MQNWVVIPARNEADTIAQVLGKVREFVERVVVVDDGSEDDTFLQAQKAGAMVLRHGVNLGKGAALKTGCEYALSHGASSIITMDADGQHDPAEIPLFLEALQRHDIVFGARQIPQSMPFIFRWGNKFMSSTLKVLYQLNIEDSQCGYRAFTAASYPKIRWEALNYYVETEMVIRTGKHQLKHAQVPIKTIYADSYKGTTVLDGVLIVGKMVGWRLWH